MASKTSIKSAKVASPGELGDSRAASKIRFSATLLRPKATAMAVSWTFLILPKEASAKLPSRSMTSVEGTFNGLAFRRLVLRRNCFGVVGPTRAGYWVIQ
jgi:hypothetical protein